MIRLEHKAFRCALCGRFAKEGVTEDDPKIPTAVCRRCVQLGSLLVWPDESDESSAPVDESSLEPCIECGAQMELDERGLCWACAARLGGDA